MYTMFIWHEKYTTVLRNGQLRYACFPGNELMLLFSHWFVAEEELGLYIIFGNKQFGVPLYNIINRFSSALKCINHLSDIKLRNCHYDLLKSRSQYWLFGKRLSIWQA